MTKAQGTELKAQGSKLKAKIILVVIMLLVTPFIAPPPSYAQDLIEISVPYANLREGPGLNFPIIKRGLASERFAVVGGAGYWTLVEIEKGVRGWIRNDLFKIVEVSPEKTTESSSKTKPRPTPSQEDKQENATIEDESKTDQWNIDDLKGSIDDLKTLVYDLSQRLAEIEEQKDTILSSTAPPPSDETEALKEKKPHPLHLGIGLGWFMPEGRMNNIYGSSARFEIEASYMWSDKILPRVNLGFLRNRGEYSTDNNHTENTVWTILSMDMGLNIFIDDDRSTYIGLGPSIAVTHLSPSPFYEDSEEKNDTNFALGPHIILGHYITVREKYLLVLEFKLSHTNIKNDEIHNAGGLLWKIGLGY